MYIYTFKFQPSQSQLNTGCGHLLADRGGEQIRLYVNEYIGVCGCANVHKHIKSSLTMINQHDLMWQRGLKITLKSKYLRVPQNTETILQFGLDLIWKTCDKSMSNSVHLRFSTSAFNDHSAQKLGTLSQLVFIHKQYLLVLLFVLLFQVRGSSINRDVNQVYQDCGPLGRYCYDC